MPSSQTPRRIRRQELTRAQRKHSFARMGGRALPAALAVAFLPLGLAGAAHARPAVSGRVHVASPGLLRHGLLSAAAHPNITASPTDTWDGTTGDWNTATSWSLGVVPNGSGNVFYAVVNPAGANDNLTHSSSTGPGGVDTIVSFANQGVFNLTGGILAGSSAGAAFTNSGTVNINGGTLRSFTVSGTPLAFSGSGNNFLDGDIFQSSINLNNGVARILNTLTLQSGSVANVSGGAYLVASDNGTTHADTLSGPVLFDGNGGNQLGIDGGVTLTLAAGSLVHGATATIGNPIYVGGTGALVNNGTISSDGGGTITLNTAPVTNNGTLQAKASGGATPVGSTLLLNTAVNNAGGVINVADTASHVVQNGVAITGGTVTGVNGSTANNVLGGLQASNSGSNFLNGVTFDGGALVTDNGQERFTGSLTFQNGGIARLNNAYLTASGPAGSTDTLSGPVLFDGNGANQLGIDGGVTLTLAAGSLVHGVTATIGTPIYVGGSGTLVNNGTISSDGGGTFNLATAPVTNAGTLQAKQSGGATPVGSTLTLSTAVNNAGGVINVADTASHVVQNGVAITGGTVTGVSGNTGGGGGNNVLGGLQASNSGSNFLNGVTFDGGALVTDNGQERFTGSLTFQNGGIARLNNATLTASDNGTTHADTLSGPVLFDGNGANQLGIDGGVTLTLAAGSLVHGATATIGNALYVGGAGTLVNNATISSDGGGTFSLVTAPVTNNGLLQAKQSTGGTGSTLLLNTAVVNTTAGVINVADTASHVVQNGVSITGGRVTGVNGSTTNNVLGGLQANNNSANFLNGVTFDGGALVTDNGQERFTGSLTFQNGGIARLNNAYLTASGPAGSTDTLSGPVLFDGNGANQLGIDGGVTLTLAAGSLVHGAVATIGNALYVGGAGTLVNNATISSDGGGTFTLTSSAVSNNGLLQAKQSVGGAGSTLTLNTNVVNTTAGVINVADTASHVVQNGVSITGGRVTGVSGNTGGGGGNNVLGGLQASNSGSNFLNGVTFDGGALVTDNGQERFTGSLTFQNGGIARLNNAYLTASDDGTTHADTLSGPVLFDGNGANQLGIDGGVTLTLAAGSLVHGATATIGNALYVGGSNALVNNGTIKSDGGGNFNLVPTTLTNGSTGTIQATGGSVTVTPTLNNAGTVLVSPGNTITINGGETQTGGVTQVDGTFTANNAPVAINGGTLKGIGTVNGNVTVTGGDVAPGDSPGTLTVGGNYTQTGGALDIEYTASALNPATNAHDLLTVTGTATLGGVLNVSYLGPQLPTGQFLATTGEPGTTFDFLTFGSLGNTGGLAGLFTNEYGNAANGFFVNGIPSNSVAGVPAQYRLSFDPNNANALQLSLTNAAAPEPSQWAAFGLGALGLGALALRARRRSVQAA